MHIVLICVIRCIIILHNKCMSFVKCVYLLNLDTILFALYHFSLYEVNQLFFNEIHLERYVYLRVPSKHASI